MHEIRASVPEPHVAEIARLAHEAGIECVSVSDVFVHGPDAPRKLVSGRGGGSCKPEDGKTKP
jgi:hypothetical protein